MALSRRPKKYQTRSPQRSGAVRGRRRPSDKRSGFILTVVDGPLQGKEYFFEKNALIGRVEENDIVLVEPGVSRVHAEVYNDQGVYFLADKGSANGTRLNGEAIAEPEVLRDGDYITFSQSTLQFSQLDATRGEVTARTQLSEIEVQAVDATGTQVDVRIVRGLKKYLHTRLGKISLIGLILALGGVGYLYATRGEIVIKSLDQSNVPIPYSEDDDFFGTTFGYNRYDKTHRYRVIINFEYLGERATLQYGAWGIDKVDEVEIILNHKKIGVIPVTMKRWTYSLKLVLPRELLKKGETNQLIFNNTFNPPHKETWGICYVQILQEAIPPPNREEARRKFELAKKLWEDHEIEDSNMYSALLAFKSARDLLEGLPERPELYQEALDYIEKVDKALTQKFSDGLFSARRAEKLENNPKKAQYILKQTQRFFHKDDFRYRELQKYLDALLEE